MEYHGKGSMENKGELAMFVPIIPPGHIKKKAIVKSC
jgi:hypothetical protein